MSAVRVGLDIGGTKIHGVLLDEAGTVLAEHRAPTESGPEGVLSGAAAAVAALQEAAAGVALEGVGVGVPGVVDPGTGTVRYAMNLGLGAEPFAFAESLSARLGGVRVAVENDLNAAALGAVRLLCEPDLAYLALGTGVAAGLVLDGRLRRGRHGLAGEVGHLPVDPEGMACPCGQRGCLELYASGSGLARQYAGEADEPLPRVVFEAAARGEALAVEVRDRLLDGVAETVQVLVLTLDVGTVVLGGGIARLGGELLDGVRLRLEQREASSPFLASSGLARRVRLAPGDVPVGAVGAAALLGLAPGATVQEVC